MSEHQLNLPWSIKGNTIYDAAGVPVSMALPYTSVKERHEDGATYYTSEYARGIRNRLIVDAVNAYAGGAS